MTNCHSNIGHNGGPSLNQPRKVISIIFPISINTMVKHAWGAAQIAQNLSDKELVKAWAYSHAAKVMQSQGISPKSYNHRRHHHIMPQIADNRRVDLIDEEMETRGLLVLYEIDFSIRPALPVQ